MKKKMLLDSYALLAYLKKEDNYREVKEALSSDASCIMNELNVGEVYYILSRHRGDEQAGRFIDEILPSLPIRVLPNDFKRVIEASRLKAKHAVSFMDCFAIATAISEGAVIVTGDREFKKAEGLVKIKWL